MKNDAASRKIQTPSTRADDRTLTLAFARYARKHNEYASTVRSNPELRAAAVREWNELIDQKAERRAQADYSAHNGVPELAQAFLDGSI